jgi:hypothetical protein
LRGWQARYVELLHEMGYSASSGRGRRVSRLTALLDWIDEAAGAAIRLAYLAAGVTAVAVYFGAGHLPNPLDAALNACLPLGAGLRRRDAHLHQRPARAGSVPRYAGARAMATSITAPGRPCASTWASWRACSRSQPGISSFHLSSSCADQGKQTPRVPVRGHRVGAARTPTAPASEIGGRLPPGVTYAVLSAINHHQRCLSALVCLWAVAWRSAWRPAR